MFELANCSVNAVCDVGSVIQESFVHLVKWKQQQSRELIDNAVVSNNSVQFQFRDDPVFSSVTPNTVIPAYVCKVVENAWPHYYCSEVELF